MVDVTDDTYIKVKGKWVYLYRTIYKYGDRIDFMLRHFSRKRSNLVATL